MDYEYLNRDENKVVFEDELNFNSIKYHFFLKLENFRLVI